MTQLTVAFGHRPLRTQGHPPPQSYHDPTSLLGGGIEMTILLGSLLLTVSYIAAIVLVTGARPDGRHLVTAYLAGVLVFLPAPLLAQLLILPAVAYLAFFGWVVPAGIVEARGFRASFRRSAQLARADYVHAVGGLAVLVIVFYVVRLMLALLIRGGGEIGRAVGRAPRRPRPLADALRRIGDSLHRPGRPPRGQAVSSHPRSRRR